MAQKIEQCDILTAARDYYMDYAKSTITDRMFVGIDGLKPVQRRGLYAMYDMAIKDGKITKSAKVVGETMGEYHPHGDASIYEALCHMSETYEAYNAPLVVSSGTLGKQWADSDSIPTAHMRYTEMGLSDFATKNYFSGLNANAVDMIPNYLNTSKEPLLLPVTYPSIIVNSSKGIACGLSSYLPTYELKNVCKATIALLKGNVSNSEDLAKELGIPDFSTGGIVGISRKQLIDLCQNGETRGIVITSRYVMQKGNVMHITEIPYNTTVDKIKEQIEDLILSKSLPGVTRVANTTGNLQLGLDIFLQRGQSPEEIFKMLCAFTDVQKRISFSTKLVNFNTSTRKYELIICGVHELLSKHWIPWRIETLRRIYAYNLMKLKEAESKINAWKKISGRVEEYLNIATRNKRKQAVELHKQKFGLTEEEESYLIAHHVYSYTQDEVLANLAKLEENLKKQGILEMKLNDDYLVKQDIIEQLEEIIAKFGTERRSGVEGLNAIISFDKKTSTISNREVYVGLTKGGYIKRADTLSEVNTFSSRIPEQDSMWEIFKLRNTDKLLIFTTYGYVYKLTVNLIDNGPKSKFKDTIWHLVDKEKEDKGEPFAVMPAGEYNKEFNIVYPKLIVRKIKTSMYKGRNIYRNSFPGYTPTLCSMTTENELLLITDKWRACYVNLNLLNKTNNPTKQNMTLKLPHLPEDENIKFAVPVNEIEDFLSKIDYYYTGTFKPIRKGDLVKKQTQETNATTIAGVKVQETEYTHDEESDEPNNGALPPDVNLSYLYSDEDMDEDDMDL